MIHDTILHTLEKARLKEYAQHAIPGYKRTRVVYTADGAKRYDHKTRDEILQDIKAHHAKKKSFKITLEKDPLHRVFDARRFAKAFLRHDVTNWLGFDRREAPAIYTRSRARPISMNPQWQSLKFNGVELTQSNMNRIADLTGRVKVINRGTPVYLTRRQLRKYPHMRYDSGAKFLTTAEKAQAAQFRKKLRARLERTRKSFRSLAA